VSETLNADRKDLRGRNASPMQGDQGAAIPGVILELLQVGGPNPKNFRKWRGPFLNGFLSGIDRYRSANQKGLKWRKRPVNRISVNECAQCGADLMAADWSEHVTDYCVRNVWSCEACGYQFEDTVYLSAREVADAS
jgi:ribosomal protein L37AE/L43A